MRRVVVAMAVLLMACMSVTAADQKPNAVMASGDLYIGLIDPGSAICSGGQPTGTFPPCSPGTKRIVWRDFVGAFLPVPAPGPGAEYFTGMFLTPGNCNLNEQYRGHCWGTFEGPGAGGGTWQGTWTGTFDFLAFGADLALVGHGSGSPQMDGLLLKLESASPGIGDPNAPMPFTARVQKIN